VIVYTAAVYAISGANLKLLSASLEFFPSLRGLAQPLESIGQVMSKKDSYLSCNKCSLDLKIFSDSDSTINNSKPFQMLIILKELV